MLLTIVFCCLPAHLKGPFRATGALMKGGEGAGVLLKAKFKEAKEQLSLALTKFPKEWGRSRLGTKFGVGGRQASRGPLGALGSAGT